MIEMVAHRNASWKVEKSIFEEHLANPLFLGLLVRMDAMIVLQALGSIIAFALLILLRALHHDVRMVVMMVTIPLLLQAIRPGFSLLVPLLLGKPRIVLGMLLVIWSYHCCRAAWRRHGRA